MHKTRIALLLPLGCVLSAGFAVNPPAGEDRPVALDADGIPLDAALVEGDILIPREWLDDGRATFASNLWPNSVIPYAFDANVSQNNRNAAIAAMAEIEAVCGVDFRVRSNEGNYIRFRSSTANNSFVGMVGGPQAINIISWGARFVIVHELMHATGFYHEQSRADRDAYIQIALENVCQTCCSGSCNINFGIRPDAGPHGSNEYGPYDFDSLMHYSSITFSANGLPTIVVLPPNQDWQNSIGQRTHISLWDARVLRFLYPYPGDRFLDASYVGISGGGFFTPYSIFALAHNATPANGTLWCQPGEYPAIGDWRRPMTLEAPLGGVTLGE